MEPTEKATKAILDIKYNIRAAQTSKKLGSSPSSAVQVREITPGELVDEINRLSKMLKHMTEEYQALADTYIEDPFSLEYERVEKNRESVKTALKAARLRVKAYRFGTKSEQNHIAAPVTSN